MTERSTLVLCASASRQMAPVLVFGLAPDARLLQGRKLWSTCRKYADKLDDAISFINAAFRALSATGLPDNAAR